MVITKEGSQMFLLLTAYGRMNTNHYYNYHMPHCHGSGHKVHKNFYRIVLNGTNLQFIK